MEKIKIRKVHVARARRNWGGVLYWLGFFSGCAVGYLVAIRMPQIMAVVKKLVE